jgi:radical SAM superfamily enzyme YgiQ (UPF0313 family)
MTAKSVLLIEPATETPASYEQRSDRSRIDRDRASIPVLRLNLPLIAAMFPNDYEVTIAYQLAHDISADVFSDFDLVGFSATRDTCQVSNAIRLSQLAEDKGVPTLVGGPATMYRNGTLLPDLKKYFDSVLIGEADPLIHMVCRDLENGALRKEYRSDHDWHYCDVPTPRFDLVNFELFQEPHVFPVQTARGCPRKCTFCSEFLYGPWRFRPIDEIVEELAKIKDAYGARRFVSRDDDFLVHPKRSRELLPKLAKLDIEWTCQTDLHLSKNWDVAKLAMESGMKAVCFGLESIVDENRKDIGKNFFAMEEASQLIRHLEASGVEVQINIIFGLDHDDPGIFNETLTFLLDHKMSTFYANILDPEPGTALYRKLESEGRILHQSPLEIEAPENLGFRPKRLSPQELVDGTLGVRAAFHARRGADSNFWLGRERTYY